MPGTSTKGPVAVLAVAVAVGVVALAATNLPSRMPPDPFEDEEPREVVLEVYWEGGERRQLIAYDVGDDQDEFRTKGTPFPGLPGWHWEHVTTALPGTIARVSSIQLDKKSGPISCAVHVDENPLGVDRTERPGCFVEVQIP